MDKIKAKQQRFVEEYLKDLDASKAAERAGYKGKYLNRVGFNLLQKEHIKAAIADAQKQRSERTQITQDRVVKELALIAFSNIGDYCTFGPSGVKIKDSSEVADEKQRAIASFHETETQFGGSKNFKLHDKVRALELLGKHLGMFVERVANPDGSPLNGAPIVHVIYPSNGRESPDNKD